MLCARGRALLPPRYGPTFRYDITIKREERDVNFGYALLPSASASVGYKEDQI